MDLLVVERLSKSNFALFGDVIEIAGAHNFPINGGTTTRYHDLAKVELLGNQGRAMVSIFRGQPRPLPLEIAMMERHPLGSQAFYPIGTNPYVVVVAEDDNGKPQEPRAFLATGDQGVNYHANIWHHPLLALQRVSDFLVVDRGGPGENLEEAVYQRPYIVEKL